MEQIIETLVVKKQRIKCNTPNQNFFWLLRDVDKRIFDESCGYTMMVDEYNEFVEKYGEHHFKTLEKRIELLECNDELTKLMGYREGIEEVFEELFGENHQLTKKVHCLAHGQY